MSRRWTPQDDEWLERNIGHKSWRECARYLHCNDKEVKGRAKYLGLRKYDIEYGYTLSDLMMIFGTLNGDRIRGWIRNGLLTATKRKSDRKRDYWNISQGAIKRFLTNNPQHFLPDRFKNAGSWELIMDIMKDKSLKYTDIEPRTGRSPAEGQSLRRADRIKLKSKGLPPFICPVCGNECPALNALGQPRKACGKPECSGHVAGKASVEARRIAKAPKDMAVRNVRTPEDGMKLKVR